MVKGPSTVRIFTTKPQHVLALEYKKAKENISFDGSFFNLTGVTELTFT